MIISGLLLTLSEDAQLAESAEAALRARPEFTLADRSQRWLPVAIEVEDVRGSRDLHDWLNALPGVDFVDVVQVNFEEGAAEDAEALVDSEEVRVNARPHPNPLPRGEGTASGHASLVGQPSGQSRRRYPGETAKDSPSPGGEGRGEGGRRTIRSSPRAAEFAPQSGGGPAQFKTLTRCTSAPLPLPPFQSKR